MGSKNKGLFTGVSQVTQIHKVETMIGKHVGTVTEAMAKKKLLERKKIELQIKANQVSDEVNNLSNKNANLEAKCLKETKLIEQSDAQIDSMSDEIAKIREKIFTIESKHSNLMASLKIEQIELQEKIAAFNIENEHQSQFEKLLLSDMREEIEDLKDELVRANRECEDA